MKHNPSHLIAAIAVALALTACGTSKQTTITDTPTTIDINHTPTIQTVAQSVGRWQTMQCSGQVKLGGIASLSSSVQVRMVRNSAIQISIRPLLGIEAARILVTRDSIIILDKLHKRYLAESVTALSGGMPVTISDVQDIFMGRPFVLGRGSVDTTRTELVELTWRGDKGFDLIPRDQPNGFSYHFAYNEQRHITALSVQPAKGNTANYNVNYARVLSTIAGDIAHAVDIACTLRNRDIELHLTYDDITWNGAFIIDTAIPRNYTRMAVGDLSGLLAQ